MKGAKSTRQPYGNTSTERKNGKRSEKHTKLDRKSSRGMIYENEELRLRTININAEVERGQSDIKRLRRENEHLRREIWTLRDECDRLNKRFKAKLVENTHDHGGCGTRGSGCSGRRGSCDGMHSNSNSDDSDSCDTCKGNNDDHCNDDYKYTPNDCCYDGSCKLPPFSMQQQQILGNDLTAKFSSNHASENLPNTTTSASAESGNSNNSDAQQLHTNFDHLSVVSEETMSNSELLSQTQQLDNLLGSQMTLPSLVGPLTPLTPIELVANELHDLQAMVPPLSYFENVVQRHMTNAGTSPESGNTTNSGKTVIHTNGWDYNLQSPFTQRKYPSHSSSSSSSAPRSPLSQTRYPPTSTLTTFVPTNTLSPPTIVRTDVDVDGEEQPVSEYPSVPSIETVAITTISPTGSSLNSPKHFFAPLKPRLKINTSLANKSLLSTPVSLSTVLPTQPTTPLIVQHQNRDPPDIFVANALASPYQRPTLTTATTTVLPSTQLTPSPPPLPQRQSSQVSPRQQSQHNHQQQQQHHHHHHQLHHQHHKRHQHELHVVTADIVVAKNDDVADVVENASATAAGTNTKSPQLQQAYVPYIQQQQGQQLQNFNPIYSKLNEPIYATAKKRCNNLISAPAVTQPLMTTAIVATPPSHARKSSGSVSSITTSVGQKQTDSANLEAILNDIETISEDILAIQMEKNKSRGNINTKMTPAPENSSVSTTVQSQKRLQQNDKNKKPYRSEMNLMLAYDGTNQVITATGSTAANVMQPVATTSVANENNNTTRRTRSLEREHTESPSPNVPDPMAPFPPNRTYIGFDQLNAAAGIKKPPLPPSQVVAQVPQGNMAKIGSAASKPGTPIKVLPPVPPVRLQSSPLHVRNAGTAQLPQQTKQTEQLVDQSAKAAPPIVGLAPNKSQLFAAIANAAVVKRAQFLAAPSHLSRSLDTDGVLLNSSEQDSQSAEAAAKKKARRVSILCGDSSNEGGSNETFEEVIATTAAISSTPQGSCTDLKAINPLIMNLRQTQSQSTPNSPHSMRRESNELTERISGGGTTYHQHSCTPGAQQSQLQPSGIALAQQQQQRKSSQDSTNCITAAAAELAAAAAAAVASRSKCSRRHSDGTVIAGVQRISGTSSHHHHHHNHHRHHHQQQQQQQHSSSNISNNPHHSHHSHPESNHDSAAESISGRNSSMTSSRDSSTSFSMRSQRRKISVSSHTGGKIPWCGCWGNGCL